MDKHFKADPYRYGINLMCFINIIHYVFSKLNHEIN